MNHSGADRQIGSTQIELLREAVRKPNGQIMIDPATQNARWCAMKRMVRRGLFDRHLFGNGVIGAVVVYEITQAGRGKYRRVDNEDLTSRMGT